MSTIIESGIQLLARLSENSGKSLDGLESQLFPEGLKRKETVEISGEPGSGKTLLLTQLIANCILPTEYSGLNVNVLLINTDHHFQVQKLAQIMRNIIKKSCKSSDNLEESKLKNVIEVSLKNLLIINCTNNYQFICNLYSISHILNFNSKIRIIAIDSISAFYWQNREMSDKNPMTINSFISNILNEIQQSSFQFNVRTIFSKHSEFTTKGQNVPECVAQPTLRRVNHRINLSKTIDSSLGLCKVESINGFRTFGYETTKVGLKWFKDNDC